MFFLNLASAEAIQDKASIKLTSLSFDGEVFIVPFPSDNSISKHKIKLRSDGVLDLRCVIFLGIQEVGFGLEGLGVGDVLNIFRHADNAMTAMVFHNPDRIVKAPCRAYCADGKSKLHCIDCRSGKIAIKVCC